MRQRRTLAVSSTVIAALLLLGLSGPACSSLADQAEQAWATGALSSETEPSLRRGAPDPLLAIGPGGPNSGMGLGMIEGVPEVALRCDESPEIEYQTVCGQEIPRVTTYEWSECHAGLRKSRQGRDMNGAGSSGSVVVTSVVSGTTDTCDATSSVQIDESIRVAVSRVTPRGLTIAHTGVLESTSRHPLGASEYVKEVKVDLHRELTNDSAQSRVSGDIRGEATVAYTAAGGGVQRTLDGALRYDFGDAGSGTLELESVIRVDSSVCWYPVGGKVTRTDTQNNVTEIAYSGACGQATVNGATIGLGDVEGYGGRGHGRGAHHGRGNGNGNGRTHQGRMGSGDCPLD